jgi:hypothetical protein
MRQSVILFLVVAGIIAIFFIFYMSKSKCTPQCVSGKCGSDGCGGTCGCPPASACIDGNCCTPQCVSGKCGSDGCGGTCGCPPASACIDGNCCTPRCESEKCGDGCGGNCGCSDLGKVILRYPNVISPVIEPAVFQKRYDLKNGILRLILAYDILSITFLYEQDELGGYFGDLWVYITDENGAIPPKDKVRIVTNVENLKNDEELVKFDGLIKANSTKYFDINANRVHDGAFITLLSVVKA